MRKQHRQFMALILITFFSGLGSAFGQIGEQRVWTDTQGREVEARLMKIEADAIVIKIGIREHRLELGKLSETDRRYVDDLRPKPPVGKVTDYPISPDSELEAWLKTNNMRSLQWKGVLRPLSNDFTLPFQLHAPPETAENGGKSLPLLVHLHGTGGIGQDNLRQFSDGGGVARKFMDKGFQKYQETYIMVPQTAGMSGWYALSYTDPSYDLRAIVDAIRVLADSPDYRIDLSRIYITGLSMGGAGVFQAMAKFPEFFAAAIPISYVDTPKIFNESNVGPMWVIINKGDSNYEERLRAFRKHYLAMGGSIRVTLNDKKGHDAWSSLLGDQKFRNWLFRRELEPD